MHGWLLRNASQIPNNFVKRYMAMTRSTLYYCTLVTTKMDATKFQFDIKGQVAISSIVEVRQVMVKTRLVIQVQSTVRNFALASNNNQEQLE